jgi:hypothetical protein
MMEFPGWTKEATGLQIGDKVKIISVYHSQGYIDSQHAVGKTMTVEGVNYDQHWVHGKVEDGQEIGLSTFFVERVEE